MTKTSFKFKGVGSEYFKIWLVNLTFSILTLGIYSAWAKVRTKQYFYSNLSYQNHHFNYLASPIVILKGRIIAVVALIIYLISANYHPLLNNILAILLTIVAPWMIYRSIRFNARVSQFRNVRFDFGGLYLGALKVFLIYPILIIFSFGLLYPWVKKQQIYYIINNLHYGNTDFKTSVTTGQFYKIYTKVSLLTIILMILIIMSLNLSTLSVADPQEIIDLFIESVWSKIIIVLLIVGYFVASIYIYTQTTNIIYNTTTIDDKHYLSANLSTLGLLKIYATYGLLNLVTFGIAYAWFKIAKMHYFAEHIQLTLSDTLETVIDNINNKTSAVGEELGNVFDTDIGSIFG